jgi:hypothetical protein
VFRPRGVDGQVLFGSTLISAFDRVLPIPARRTVDTAAGGIDVGIVAIRDSLHAGVILVDEKSSQGHVLDRIVGDAQNGALIVLLGQQVAGITAIRGEAG